MIALVYASLLIFAATAPAITPLGWRMIGVLALVIFAYLMIAEWMQRRVVRELRRS